VIRRVTLPQIGQRQGFCTAGQWGLRGFASAPRFAAPAGGAGKKAIVLHPSHAKEDGHVHGCILVNENVKIPPGVCETPVGIDVEMRILLSN